MIRYCKRCGVAFTPYRKKIYCSRECQRADYKSKNPEYIKSYKFPEQERKSGHLDEKLRKFGCESYAERQKAETLRLIREGIL